MSARDYTYTSKEVEEYTSSAKSPIENNIVVGGCPFNSLVEHPYKAAFARFGVPAGLVIANGGTNELPTTTLTREMVHKGGSAVIPSVVNDNIYDELFHKVSIKKPERRLTRKKRA